jgi:glucose/arabinose dehydrogenase
MAVMSLSASASRPRRNRTGVLAAWVALLMLISWAVAIPSAAPAAAVVSGFTELTAFSGLIDPTAVRFAPDGRIFVAEKRGTIQMYEGLDDPAASLVVDLRPEVHNFWDRGLLGLAVDPAFPTRPYLYALYTFDGPIGGSAPRWGTAGTDSDPCPDPPGATGDGCVASGKLVKLTLDLANPSVGSTTKQDLLNDWCQQYPSHGIGDLVFGRDGALYVSGGDGASFDWVDYGQDGDPVNPCGDPPGGVGGGMTPPSAEGGARRAQDLRTPADPVSLDGSVVRVSPDTGLALPDNPNAAATDENARRMVAYGLRNPFRLTVRPGTDEVWIGDPGWNATEEVNRLRNPTGGVTSFGWPCYEGSDRQSAYAAAGLTMCEDLYAQGPADTPPYFSYPHGRPLSPSDSCDPGDGSSVSGLSFHSGRGPYPPEYDDALFFADYSRSCIWVMTKGTNGLPDERKIRPFVSRAASPVDLELSPEGELFYADLTGGTIRRIVYSGTAPPCPDGQYLAEYFPNTTLSGDPATAVCEPSPLDHDWGTGAPAGIKADGFSARWSGTFSFPARATYTFTAVGQDGIRVWVDGTLLIDQWQNQSAATVTGSRVLRAGAHEVRMEWFDTGGDAVAGLDWSAPATDARPQPQITAPASGTTWRVGDVINFSGAADDPEDGPLPASALSWEMVLHHCSSGGGCHAHQLQTWTGVAGGSIAAPDHEYPAHLELGLTARDAGGRTATVRQQLDPQTVSVTLDAQPAGLRLTLGSRTASTPFTVTLIVGATSNLSAPSPQRLSGTPYKYGRWSDGGARSHNITVGTNPVTYTATFTERAAGAFAPVVSAETPSGE